MISSNKTGFAAQSNVRSRDYRFIRIHTGIVRANSSQTLSHPAQDYGLTLILGGAEGTLWDITNAYAQMAWQVNQFGNDQPPGNSKSFHSYFTNNAGKSEKYEIPLSPAACWNTFEAMVEVIRPAEENQWQSFTSSQKVAWKTGTSYGHRDAWAIGVTTDYAIGVWVGNADGEGRPGLTGIRAAA